MEALSPQDGGDRIYSPPKNAHAERLMDAIEVPDAKLVNAYLVSRYGRQVMWAMRAAERRDLYRAAVSGALTPEELISETPLNTELDDTLTAEPLPYAGITRTVEIIALPENTDGDDISSVA